MIPVKTKAVEVDNLIGLPGEEEVAFTIGNAAWVMKSLSKLYSNNVLATVREYSTNARDAHVEAGKSDVPIEVTLPSLYHPFFEVEDFGVGMSKATLKNTFTKFGDSTKRESNLVNGMLGFGSKSALAYADSFTVRTRKDGIETEAIIVRKADWSISLRITAERKTDEPNGTKIQIPSRDYDAFKRIAMDFYRFWEPGTVLVDGSQPDWAVGDRLDDNLYYSKSHGTSYVVMGNVAYRIANPDALFRNRGMNTISFVAYVPNGSVEFTPSREDLEYTDATKATLHGVIENFEKKIVAQAKSEIDAADDYFDAYVKYTYWTNKLGKGPFGDLEFKGEKFMDHITGPFSRYAVNEMRYNMYRVESWAVSQMNDSLIITNLPSTPNSNHKSRAKKYRNQIGISARYILFTPSTNIDCIWVDPKRIVDWETVKEATKPPKKPRDAINRPKRIKGTFDYETKDGAVWEKELPDTQNLFYITIADDKLYNVRNVLRLLDSDAVVVRLAVNRINKFKRDNPHVSEFVSSFKPRVNLNGIDFLDAQTKAALAIGEHTRQWISTLNVNNINDPEFKRIKNLLDADQNTRLERYNNAWNLAIAMNMRYNFKQHDIRRTDDTLLDKYPLLSTIHPRYGMTPDARREYEFYINAKYAERTKKGN